MKAPPTPVGVYVTWQLAAVAVGLPNEQGLVTKLPVPSLVKETMPVGAVATDAGSVSVTVTVQVEASPTITEAGTQATTVEVE